MHDARIVSLAWLSTWQSSPGNDITFCIAPPVPPSVLAVSQLLTYYRLFLPPKSGQQRKHPDKYDFSFAQGVVFPASCCNLTVSKATARCLQLVGNSHMILLPETDCAAVCS